MEKLNNVKNILKDLSSNNKIAVDDLKKISDSLGEVESEVANMESQNKELRDKLTDMILHTPMEKSSNVPDTTEEGKSFEECLIDELSKNNK